MRFMEPLAQELLKCLEAKAPAKNPDVADELAKAKAKMAEHGITMSPVKRKHDQDSEPSNSADKRAKPTLPHAEPESQSEAQQLLSDSYRKLDSRPKGATNEHVAEWLAGFKPNPNLKASTSNWSSMSAQRKSFLRAALPKMKWSRQPHALDWTADWQHV